MSALGQKQTSDCHCCHWVWQVDLSSADKLMLVADAVAPVREAIAATAQAAVDAGKAPLRLGHYSMSVLDELEPANGARAPAGGARAVGIEKPFPVQEVLGKWICGRSHEEISSKLRQSPLL